MPEQAKSIWSNLQHHMVRLCSLRSQWGRLNHTCPFDVSQACQQLADDVRHSAHHNRTLVISSSLTMAGKHRSWPRVNAGPSVRSASLASTAGGAAAGFGLDAPAPIVIVLSGLMSERLSLAYKPSGFISSLRRLLDALRPLMQQEFRKWLDAHAAQRSQAWSRTRFAGVGAAPCRHPLARSNNHTMRRAVH
jgi:hypothetical protein